MSIEYLNKYYPEEGDARMAIIISIEQSPFKEDPDILETVAQIKRYGDAHQIPTEDAEAIIACVGENLGFNASVILHPMDGGEADYEE